MVVETVTCLFIILMILAIRVSGRYFFRDDVKMIYSWSEASVELLANQGFGFHKGGVVAFSLQCDLLNESLKPPTLWLLLCTMSGGRQFAKMGSSQLKYHCHRLDKAKSESHVDDTKTDSICNHTYIERNATGAYYLTHLVENNYYYRFLLLQCPKNPTQVLNNSYVTEGTCQSVLMAVNPNNEHLSSDEMPMIIMYYTFLSIWGVLVILWFGNSLYYRRYSNKLHKLLTLAPILKLLIVSIELSRWHNISQTGMEFDSMENITHFFRSLEDALLFTLILVISRGWGLINCKMNNFRWTSFVFFFIVFAVSLMCVSWVHNYFLAFSICCVVFLTYKSLKCCSLNIEFLQRRRRKFRHFVHRCHLQYCSSATVESQLAHKVEIFTRFRLVCAAYSLAFSLVVTLAMFLNEYSYVQTVTYELPKLMAYVALGVIFRLRNFKPFEHIELTPPKENVMVFMLPEVSTGYVYPEVVLGIPDTAIQTEPTVFKKRKRRV